VSADITPERIAEHLTGIEVREGGQCAGWVDVAAEGAALRIGFTRRGTPGEVTPFRAVVVKGDGPVVVASPELLAAARALYRWHAAASSLSAVDTALAALTPDQVAVLAGDEDAAMARPTADISMSRAEYERLVNARFDAIVRRIGSRPVYLWPADIAALREQVLNLDVSLEAVQSEQDADLRDGGETP